MAQGSVKDTTGYVNYVYNISARGTTEVASQLMGLSGMASNVLGQLAFQTSSYLSTTEGALLSMGVVATAGFAKATQQAMEFDQALSTIGAISGKTRDEVTGLGEQAMAMSSKFGVATSEMTEGLESLARAGVSTNNMFSILEQAMGLSKLEGLSLDTAINDLISTTNLLDTQGLDLSSPEYAEAVAYQNQKITATSEAAPINAQDIIHTLEHVGGYASSTNLDQDDLYAVIAQLGSKGTKSEMAGTSLRAFLAAGQKDTAQRALARIGLKVSDLWKNDETIMSISDMKDVLDEAMDAKGYTQQEKIEFYSDFAGYKQANQIMKIDTSSVREFKEKIDHSWNIGQKINQVIGTAETHVQGLLQAGTNLLTKVGEPFLPIISTIAWTLRTGIDIINMIPGSNLVIAGGLILASVKAISTIFNKIAPQIVAAKGNIGGIRGLFMGIREDLSESYTLIKNIKNVDFMKGKTQELEAYRITDRDRMNYWKEQKNQHINSIADVWQFEQEEGFSDNDMRYVNWKKSNLEKPVNKSKGARNRRESVKNPPKGTTESSNNRKSNKAQPNYIELISAINDASTAEIAIIGSISNQLNEINASLMANLSQQSQPPQEVKTEIGDVKLDDSIIKELKNHIFKVEVVNVSRIVPVHEVEAKAWGRQKKADKEVTEFIRRGSVEVHDVLDPQNRRVAGRAYYNQKKIKLDQRRHTDTTKDHELGHVLLEIPKNRKSDGVKFTKKDKEILKGTSLDSSSYGHLGKIVNEYEADLYAVKLALKRGQKAPQAKIERLQIGRKILDNHGTFSDVREDYIDDLVNATILKDGMIKNKFANATQIVDSTTPRVKEYVKNFLNEGQVIGEVARYHTAYNKKEGKYEKVETNAERVATSDYNPKTDESTPVAPNVIKYRSDYYDNTVGGIQQANKGGYYNELIPYEEFAQRVLGHESHATSANTEGYETLLYLTKLFNKAGKSLPNTVKQRMQLIKQHVENNGGTLPDSLRLDEIDKAVNATLPFFDQVQAKFGQTQKRIESTGSVKVTDDVTKQQYTLTNLMPVANTDLGYKENLKRPITDALKELEEEGQEVLSFKDVLSAYAVDRNDEKIKPVIDKMGENAHDILSKAVNQYRANQAPNALSIPKENLMKLEYQDTGSEAIDDLQAWVEQSLYEIQEQMNLKTYSTDFKGSEQEKIDAIYKEIAIINEIIEANRINLQKTNLTETQEMVNVGAPLDSSQILSKGAIKLIDKIENLGIDFKDENGDNKRASQLRDEILKIYSNPIEQAQLLNDINSIKKSSLMESFETMIEATDLSRNDFTKLLINEINTNFSNHDLKGVDYSKVAKHSDQLVQSNNLLQLVYALSEEMKHDDDAVIDFLNNFKDIVETHRLTTDQVKATVKNARDAQQQRVAHMTDVDYEEGFTNYVDNFDPDTADFDTYGTQSINDIKREMDEEIDSDAYDRMNKMEESLNKLNNIGYDNNFVNANTIDWTDPKFASLTEEQAYALLAEEQKQKPLDLMSDTNSESYNPYYRVRFGYNFNQMGNESIFNHKTHSYHLTSAKQQLRNHVTNLALLRHELQNIAEINAQKESGFLEYQRPDLIENTFGSAYNSRYAHRSTIGKNLIISDTDSPLQAAKYAKYHTLKQNGDDVIAGRVIGEEDKLKKDPYLEQLEKNSLRTIWTTSLGHELKAGIPENAIKSNIRPVFDDLGVPYMFSRYSVGKSSQGTPAYGRMPVQGLFAGVKDAQDLSTHHVMKDESGRFSYIDSPELRLKRLVATNTSNTIKSQGMLATYDPNYELEAAGKEVDPNTSILTPANMAKIAREQLTPTMKSVVTTMFQSQQFTDLKDLKEQTGDNFEEVITEIKDRMNTMGTDGKNSVNQFKTWATDEEIEELKKQNLYDNKKYKSRTRTVLDEEGNEQTIEEHLIFDWAALQRTEDDVAQSFVTSMISRAMLATEKATELKAKAPSKFNYLNKTLAGLPANILEDPTSLLNINSADAINLAGTNSSVLFDVIAALDKLDKLDPDEISQYMDKLKIDEIDEEVLRGWKELGYTVSYDETTRTITGVMDATNELIPTFELLYTTLDNIATQSKMIFEMNQIFDPNNVISNKVQQDTINKLAEEDVTKYKNEAKVVADENGNEKIVQEPLSIATAKAKLAGNIAKNEKAIVDARVMEDVRLPNGQTIGSILGMDVNDFFNQHKDNVIGGSNFLQPVTSQTKTNLPPEWNKESNVYIPKKPKDNLDILGSALDNDYSFMVESTPILDTVNMGNVISGQPGNTSTWNSGWQSGYEESPYDYISDFVYDNVINPSNNQGPLLLGPGSPDQNHIPKPEPEPPEPGSETYFDRGNKPGAFYSDGLTGEQLNKVRMLSTPVAPGGLSADQLAIATHYRDTLHSDPTRASTYYGAQMLKNNIKQTMLGAALPYNQMMYDRFGNRDNSVLEQDLDTFSNYLDQSTSKLQGFSNFLQEASDVFPPLITAVIALDGAIGMITTVQKGAQGLQSFMQLGETLSAGKEIKMFGKIIKSDSEMGKMLMSTTGILGSAFETLETILLEFAPIIAAITAGLFVIKSALDWSYQSHEKYLKSLEEEQKEKRSKTRGLQTTNENAQEAARNNRSPRQQDRLDRNAQLAQTRLDNANMSRSYGAIEIARQKNDTLWGDYGIAAGLGKLQGNYESTAAEYDGTSGQIRRIKEATLANPFSSDAMNQVASYYDANQLAFGVMDEYKDELGKLYDSETSAMLKYHSDDVRGSPEFQKALDDFVEATGITRDHAQQYLDYMQTEHEVDKATQSMQAQADQIAASTELKVQAIAFGGNPADVLGLNGIEAQQNAMIKAQADMVKMELSGQLWWKAVWSTITTPIKLILSPIFIIVDLLNAIWSLMTGNIGGAFESGGRAASRLNVFGEAATYWGAWADTEATDFNAIGQNATDSYNRANYGNVEQSASSGYHPTHFLDANANQDKREAVTGKGYSQSPPNNGGYFDHRESQTHYINANRGSYHFMNSRKSGGSHPTEQLNPLSSIGTMLSTIISILTTGLLVGGGIYGLTKLMKSDFSLKELGTNIKTILGEKGSGILGTIFNTDNISAKIKNVLGGIFNLDGIKEGVGGAKGNIVGSIAALKEKAEWYKNGIDLDADNGGASPFVKAYAKGLSFMEENPWGTYIGEKIDQGKSAIKTTKDSYVQPWKEYLGNKYDEKKNKAKGKVKDYLSNLKTQAELYSDNPTYLGKEIYDRDNASMPVKILGKAFGVKNKIFGKAANTDFEGLLSNPKEFLSDPRNIETMAKDLYKNNKDRLNPLLSEAQLYNTYPTINGESTFDMENAKHSPLAIKATAKALKWKDKYLQGDSIQDVLKDPERTVDIIKGTYGDIQGGALDDISVEVKDKISGLFGKVKEGMQEGIEDSDEDDGLLGNAKSKLAGIFNSKKSKLTGWFDGGEEEYDWYKNADAISFGDLSVKNKAKAIGDKAKDTIMGSRLFDWYRKDPDEEYEWYQNADAIEFGDLSGKNQLRAILDTKGEALKENGLSSLNTDFGIGEHIQGKITEKADNAKNSLNEKIKSSVSNIKGKFKKENVICQFCGHENPEGSEFCEECGMPINQDTIEKGKENSKNMLKTQGSMLTQMHMSENIPQHAAQPNAHSNSQNMAKERGSMLTNLHSQEAVLDVASKSEFEFCNSCGGVVHEDDEFCGWCGARVKDADAYCPECGAAVSKDDEFCGACGTALNPPSKTQKIKNAMTGLLHKFEDKINGKDSETIKTSSVQHKVNKKINDIQNKMANVDTETTADKDSDSLKNRHKRGEWSEGMLDHNGVSSGPLTNMKMTTLPESTMNEAPMSRIKAVLQGPEGKQGAIVDKEDEKVDVAQAYKDRGVSLFNRPRYPKYYDPNLMYKEETPGAYADGASILDLDSLGDMNDGLKTGGKIAQKAGGFLKGKKGIAGKVGNALQKVGGGASKAGAKGVGGIAKGGIGKLAKGGVGKGLGKLGGKVAGKIGGKVASKALAQVGSKVLGGALMATGIGAPLGLLLESPIGGFLMEGAMDLGGKALGAIGGAVSGVGNAIGGLLGFGKKTHYQQAGSGGPGLLKNIAPGGGMLGAMAGGGIAGLMGMGVGLLGSIFKNNKDHKNKSTGIGDIAQRILKNIVDGNKQKPANSSGGSITIQNININTADDPEAIKAMFLELLIELQEQVNPRLVSRTVGEPPANSTTDTSATETPTDENANENNNNNNTNSENTNGTT